MDRRYDYNRDGDYSGHNRGGGDHKKLDDPPNSRLFIVCGKNITDSDFREAFERFGTIEEIWIVRDKNTQESKGVAYIKFSRTSEAAAALEEMNGSCIANHPRPLKVLIAHSREQGCKREMNEEERLLRLFVVVPKAMTESELRQHFSQFGDLDYVSIVKDHQTKESKGFAYVRYHRVTHAAKAFENCDRSFKPVFADPKPKNERNSQQQQQQQQQGGRGHHQSGGIEVQHHQQGYMNDVGGGGDYTRLNIIASPCLNQDQLWRLFDLVPDMDYLQLILDPQTRQYKGNAFVVYKTPRAASYARDKLHGFEYPVGQRLIVKPDTMGGLLNRPSLIGGTPNNANRFGLSIVDSFPSSGYNNGGGGGGYDDISNICSVPLPPRQPWADNDLDVAERLFIVCQPDPPPPVILKDAFSRFANLIDIFMLSGKNFGYAKYATKQSANAAINTLNGQTLAGSRLKVMLAEPARERDPGRKRPRVASDQ